MEANRVAIRDIVVSMRSTRAPIQERWDYYNNEVDEDPYFPMLADEDPDDYAKRFRLAIGWPGALADRLATYFRQEPIEITFEVGGKQDHARATEAAELWTEISKYNNYWTFMVDVARDAGVGGNGFTRERFVACDRETGEDLKTGAWNGRIKIERIHELFVYRFFDGLREVYILAWARTKTGEYKLLHDVTEEETDEGVIEYMELLQPPHYNENDGVIQDKSSRAIWRNAVMIYDPQENVYWRLPFQRFANKVSRPASENGISDIKAAIPLAQACNHTVSGMVRSIEYHGWPQMYISGLGASQDLIRGPERILFAPITEDGTKADIGILSWDQNLDGARQLHLDLTDMMFSLTGVPKHMMKDLDGSGKVPSGIALRLLYRNMNEACELKEAGFKAAEETLVKTALDMLAIHNGKGNGYFQELEVHVTYNPDRTPRERIAEIDEDMKLFTFKVKNYLDFWIKYKGKDLGIETYEEALEKIEEEKISLDKLQELGLGRDAFPPGATAWTTVE